MAGISEHHNDSVVRTSTDMNVAQLGFMQMTTLPCIHAICDIGLSVELAPRHQTLMEASVDEGRWQLSCSFHASSPMASASHHKVELTAGFHSTVHDEQADQIVQNLAMLVSQQTLLAIVRAARPTFR